MKKNNYSYDVVMQAIARIVGGIISFLAIFLLTYIYSESQLGEYNLILGSINIIASMGTLWLSQSILRFYDNKKDFGYIIVLTGLSILLCLICFFIYGFFTNITLNISAYLYVVLLVEYNIFDALFRKMRKLVSYVFLELLLAIGRVFPMVIIGTFTKDYNAIFTSQCIVVFIYIIILALKNQAIFKNTKYTIDSRMLKQYLRFGIPLMGLSISNWFLTVSDRYIINYFDGSTNVGIYSTNYSLANSIYTMFSLIIVNAYHPIIMSTWSKSKNETKHLIADALDLYIVFMVPLTFYGCLKSQSLLGLFNGELYSTHYWIFNWVAVGIFVQGLSLLFHKYYELIGDTKMILIVNLIAAITNIVLNFVLIPILGFEIAAFTTFVSYIIYIIIILLLTHKKFKISVNTVRIIKVVVPAIIFGVFDHCIVRKQSILLFFVEGIIYIIYTIIVYQFLGIYNLKMLFFTIKKRIIK